MLDGKPCQEVSDFLYLDDSTFRGWYKSYRQDGWEALAFDGWKGASVARRPRSVPLSVLNSVRITPIPAASRGRVNIHGAVNIETFDATFVESLSVEGVGAVQRRTKIEERNPDKRTIPII